MEKTEFDDKLSTVSLPEEIYDKYNNIKVFCSDCGEKLTRSEIMMHRHVGITEAEEMSCTGCWMKVDYGDMLINLQ